MEGGSRRTHDVCVVSEGLHLCLNKTYMISLNKVHVCPCAQKTLPIVNITISNSINIRTVSIHVVLLLRLSLLLLLLQLLLLLLFLPLLFLAQPEPRRI